MRIERISENTIRCTLTNFDLSMRNIKLSELTYGSENARNLFREMMQRAHNEVGFEAEDTPIMVEAIPMPNDSIILIITKVEDPEELDTRFSRFTQEQEEEQTGTAFTTEFLEGADELLNLLGNPEFLEQLQKIPNEPPKAAPPSVRIYMFDTLDLVCAAAKLTGSVFSGESTLYKNPANEKFYLILKRADSDELAFSKTCNLLSEYGSRRKYDPAVEAYYAEHYEPFIKQNALQVLKNL